MRFLQLLDVGAAFSSPFQIVENEAASPSWITVLIGKNGAKKSLALRTLLEAGLGHVVYNGRGHRPIKFKPNFLGRAPSNVIAISNTPWDRFPRGPQLGKLSRQLVQDSSRFVYIGQRAGTGNVSLWNSEVQLAFNLIEHANELDQRRENLEKVFAELGLQFCAGIRLQPSRAMLKQKHGEPWRFDDGKFAMYLQRLAKVVETLSRDRSLHPFAVASAEAYARDLRDNEQTRDRLRNVLSELHPSKVTLWLHPDRHVMHIGFQSVQEWRNVLYLGLVEIEGMNFLSTDSPALAKEARSTARESDLSSGQWNWLYNFCTLEFELRDDSLVLIEEPENSLHPTWQREYPSMLARILNDRTGCHAIIATHSVLLASGLPIGSGNLGVLEPDPLQDNRTRIRAVPSHIGWAADDLYREIFEVESSRSKEFSAAADNALRKLSRRELSVEALSLDDLTLLREAQKDLPTHDPMRSLVSAIFRQLENRGTDAP